MCSVIPDFFSYIYSQWAPKYRAQNFLGQCFSKDFRPQTGKFILRQSRYSIF